MIRRLALGLLPLAVGGVVVGLLWTPATHLIDVPPPLPIVTTSPAVVVTRPTPTPVVTVEVAAPQGVEPVAPAPPAVVTPAPEVAAGPAAVPQAASLVIASRGIRAGIAAEPIAVDATFTLVPPDDPTTVGMWGGGAPLDAQAGTTLLTGHVQTVDVARGALWHLANVQPGDEVLTAAAGRSQSWQVVDVENVPKASVPAWVFAGVVGPRQLAIVTCGGPDQAFNVIVRATPTSGNVHTRVVN